MKTQKRQRKVPRKRAMPPILMVDWFVVEVGGKVVGLGVEGGECGKTGVTNSEEGVV